MGVDDSDIVGYTRKCKKSIDDQGLEFTEGKRTSSSVGSLTQSSNPGELTVGDVECRNDDWELMRWKNAKRDEIYREIRF